MAGNVLSPRTGEINPDAKGLVWLNKQLGVGKRLTVSGGLSSDGSDNLNEEKIEMFADVLRRVGVERLIDAGVTEINLHDDWGAISLDKTADDKKILYINVYAERTRSGAIRTICEKVGIDPPDGYEDSEATRVSYAPPPPQAVRRRMRGVIVATVGLAIGISAAGTAVGVNQLFFKPRNRGAPTAINGVGSRTGETPPPPPQLQGEPAQAQPEKVVSPNPDPDPGVIRETCRVRFEGIRAMDTEGMPVGHYGSCNTTVAERIIPTMAWTGKPHRTDVINPDTRIIVDTVYDRPAVISFRLKNPPMNCEAGPIEVEVGKTRDYPDTKVTCVESQQE